MSNFGTRLKNAMKAANMTQKELAERIGITQQSVQYLCSGKTSSSKHITQIAKLLGTTPEWLESGKHEVREAPAAYNSCPTVPLFTTKELNEQKQATSRVACPFEHSHLTYAFTVDGIPSAPNPMHPTYGKAYPIGSIVFVDPSLTEQCETGDIVAIVLRESRIHTFRLLSRDDTGTERLFALNGQFPEITQSYTIVGKVIGAILP